MTKFATLVLIAAAGSFIAAILYGVFSPELVPWLRSSGSSAWERAHGRADGTASIVAGLVFAWGGAVFCGYRARMEWILSHDREMWALLGAMVLLSVGPAVYLFR